MPVKIKTINFFSELQGVSDAPVDWTLANVGDKVRVELDFVVETYAISTVDEPFIFNNTDGYIGAGWITGTGTPFKDFRVGDSIIYFKQSDSSYATKIISDKLSDSEIQVSVGFAGGDNQSLSGYVISVLTPITGAIYKWNFIENNDQVTFNSKVSGTMHQLINKLVNAGSASVLPMIFLGEKSYQTGSATIQGVTIDPGTTDGVYKSEFKIIHNTIITPIMLADQWSDLLANVAPAYFFNTNCLKGIFDIEAMYNYSDPNRIQTVEVSQTLGNTGWFNENFNTGLTNYSVASVVYKNAAGTVIPKLQLTSAKTSVVMTINNTVDSPFSNTNTKFALNFCKAPNDASEYQLNGRTIDENFVFDHAIQKVGIAAVNGDQYGGLRTVLKNITATYINATQITIAFDVLMGSDAISIIEESVTPRYMLWVSIQKHTFAMKDADKVSLLCDADDFYQDNSDPGMVVLNNLFLRHPESDPNTQGIEPGTTTPVDPTPLTWTETSGQPAIVYVIDDFGFSSTPRNIIGNALWNTDWATTLADLVTSMNTNTDADPTDATTMKANTGFSTFGNVGGYVGSTAFISAAIQPGNISWGPMGASSTRFQLIDMVSGKSIGYTDWDTDMDTTFAKLVISVNTNTPNGTIFNGSYPFGGAHGYTASYNSGTDTFTIAPPANVKDTYNGRTLFLANQGGSATFPGGVQGKSFSGGADQVNTFTITPPTGVGASINGQNAFFYSWNGRVIVTTQSSGQQWAGGFGGVTTYFDVSPEDEIVAYTQFFIDSNGRTLADIILKSVEAKIKIKNSVTLDEFELDGFSLNTSTYPLIAGVQYYDFEIDRPFHIPAASIRKMIQSRRRDDLDGGGEYFFEVWFPFLMRWEYWAKLAVANGAFFNTSQPQNGFNEFWHHYQTGNWGIYYELIVRADEAGALQTYNIEVPIRSNDYNSNAAWDTKTIKTYDSITLAQLLATGKNYILGYQDTLVKATFRKVSGAPVLSDCTVVFRLEVFEEGGVTGSRRFSSAWVADADTWFKSTDTSDKVVLSLTGQTVTAQCLIDFTKIPVKAKFKLTARIYEIALGGTGKVTELGVPKLIETGNFKIFE